ncbi:hypothetical protein AZ22_3577, partial [Bordetella bronchiseptica 980-2]
MLPTNWARTWPLSSTVSASTTAPPPRCADPDLATLLTEAH